MKEVCVWETTHSFRMPLEKGDASEVADLKIVSNEIGATLCFPVGTLNQASYNCSALPRMEEALAFLCKSQSVVLNFYFRSAKHNNFLNVYEINLTNQLLFI